MHARRIAVGVIAQAGDVVDRVAGRSAGAESRAADIDRIGAVSMAAMP